MKSERLKKLETELQDLEQWLNLGLVPKKDLIKHKGEIEGIKKKIDEEKNRLQSIKESGEAEGYTLPKRSPQGRQAYQEPHTIPGVDLEGESNLTEIGLDMETASYETETQATMAEESGGEEAAPIEEAEEDPFSDKNRWRRGILEDPDADSW
ncbi:MAG: hypothetical protein HYZ47_00655 [Simkania negevensis]|nr:hypothetical protein [Simkania negevensis]